MIDHDQYERLEQLRTDADQYVIMESKPSSEKTAEEREWRSGVLDRLAKASAGEAVYFAQQIVSQMETHKGCMALTVLANRLLHR